MAYMCDKETLILYTRQRQKTHSVPDMKIVTGVGGVWVCVWVCVCVLITQLCLTLCDLPGSAVHGILQARILSGLPFPSQGSSGLRDRTWFTCVSYIGKQVLY